MSVVPLCNRGPDGAPCGRATRTATLPSGECPRCWANQYTADELEILRLALPDSPVVRQAFALPCVHVGPSRPPPPGRDIRKAYFQCEAGKGVVSRCCDCGPKCDRYEPDEPDPEVPAPPGRRHLAMHVYPSRGNNTWRRSLDQVRVRAALFDGCKAVAVVTGENLEPWEAVRDYAADLGADVFPIPNNPGLREVATWRPLWDRILADAKDSDVAFYCHAKGATRPVDAGNMTHVWTSLQWSLNLDWWPDIERMLKTYPIVGCFKKVGYGFNRAHGRFHYSGTFFWVRIGDFRHRRYATDPPAVWYGTEAWPGMAYEVGEAGTFYRETPVSKTNLYCPEKWASDFRPEYYRWIGQRI